MRKKLYVFVGVLFLGFVVFYSLARPKWFRADTSVLNTARLIALIEGAKPKTDVDLARALIANRFSFTYSPEGHFRVLFHEHAVSISLSPNGDLNFSSADAHD